MTAESDREWENVLLEKVTNKIAKEQTAWPLPVAICAMCYIYAAMYLPREATLEI